MEVMNEWMDRWMYGTLIFPFMSFCTAAKAVEPRRSIGSNN